MDSRFSLSARLVGAISMLGMVSGCATLPSSGPTARQVERGATSAATTIPFQVVELNGATMRKLAPVGGGEAHFASLAREGQVDRIAPGDELQITIYEVGMTLFSAGGASFGGAGAAPAAADGAAPSKVLGGVVVAADGTIRLPYVGRLSVAGSTPYDVQRMIEQAMHGKSQSPQALVSVTSSPRNSAYLFGDVARPGRLPLSVARERLLDVVAASGGAKTPSADTLVRLTRGDQLVEMRLGDIRAGSIDDIEINPGDRIELLSKLRSFSVFGATKVAEMPFEAPEVSLAEALARAGGPTDAQADPRAIYLFRYDAAAIAAGQRPTIYRLDLMKPESYLVAQNVMMRDKDLIYIANSASGPVTKFIGVLNQLFAPVFTVRSLTRAN